MRLSRLLLVGVLLLDAPGFSKASSRETTVLQIPSSVGFVTQQYLPSDEKPQVILISDLHSNRSVQFSISRILERLDRHGMLPNEIAVEGATGSVDLTAMQKFHDPKARRRICDRLVEQGDLPGAYHFLVSKGNGKAWGIENADLYETSVRLYRHTYQDRIQLSKLISPLQNSIAKAPQNENEKKDAIGRLAALKDLLEGKLIPAELASAGAKGIQAAIQVGSLTGEHERKRWTSSASAMIDFYALALTRDEALTTNLLKLRREKGQTTSVIVVGGFHIDGIAKRLREQKTSFVVLTPRIREHSVVDQNLYKHQLLYGEDQALQAVYRSSVMTKQFYSLIGWAQQSRTWTGSVSLRRSIVGVLGFPLFAKAEQIDLTDGATQLTIGLVGAFLLALISIVIALKREKHTDEMKLIEAETKYQTWLSTFHPDELRTMREFGGERFIEFLYHRPKDVETYGPWDLLRLWKAFEGSHDPAAADSVLIHRVFPLLREHFYDVTKPNATVNRQLLLKGFQLALDKEPDRSDLSSDPKPYLTDYERETIEALIPYVTNSAAFSDEPALPSPNLKIRDLYKEIVVEEERLQNEWLNQQRGTSANNGSSLDSERAALKDMDTRFSDILDEFPSSGEVRQTLHGGTKGEAEEFFPQKGASTTGQPPAPDFYGQFASQIMKLLMQYSIRVGKFNQAEISVIFTSDLPEVALGGMTRGVHTFRSSEIYIVGGRGRYVKAGEQSEARFFKKVVDLLWGTDRTAVKVPVYLLEESGSISEHAESFVAELKRRGIGVPGSKTVRILVEQSPVMQLRAYETLKQKLVDADLPNVKLFSASPMFRDFYLAPVGWTLQEWQRRLAWETVRETAKLIGYRDGGDIRRDFEIPLEMLVGSMDISDRILQDPSIPDQHRQRMMNYRRTIQAEIVRVKSITPTATNSSSPWTQAKWMPRSIGVILAGLLYVFRVPQELAHALVLRGTGTPWAQIRINLSVSNPHVESTGARNPLAAIAGPLLHIGIGLFIVGLLPYIGTFPILALVVKSVAVLNLVELLGVALPYRVQTRTGETISSDAQEFVDGIVEQLNRPGALRLPKIDTKALLNLDKIWAPIIGDRVRVRISGARQQILLAVQA